MRAHSALPKRVNCRFDVLHPRSVHRIPVRNSIVRKIQHPRVVLELHFRVDGPQKSDIVLSMTLLSFDTSWTFSDRGDATGGGRVDIPAWRTSIGMSKSGRRDGRGAGWVGDLCRRERYARGERNTRRRREGDDRHVSID